jgi:hypothetical protein
MARSPGRAGLPDERSGTGAEARLGRDYGFHAKARSREVPMRKGQFFARALGPGWWSRPWGSAIRACGAVARAGWACLTSDRERGRRAGRAAALGAGQLENDKGHSGAVGYDSQV